MAKNRVHRAGPELITESSFHFEKQDDGYFKRVENIHVRDIKTNSVKLQKETVHDEMYEITKGPEYDYQVSYDDPDSGHQAYLRFKKV